jgi:hypothetical protein
MGVHIKKHCRMGSSDSNEEKNRKGKQKKKQFIFEVWGSSLKSIFLFVTIRTTHSAMLFAGFLRLPTKVEEASSCSDSNEEKNRKGKQKKKQFIFEVWGSSLKLSVDNVWPSVVLVVLSCVGLSI